MSFSQPEHLYSAFSLQMPAEGVEFTEITRGTGCETYSTMYPFPHLPRETFALGLSQAHILGQGGGSYSRGPQNASTNTCQDPLYPPQLRLSHVPIRNLSRLLSCSRYRPRYQNCLRHPSIRSETNLGSFPGSQCVCILSRRIQVLTPLLLQEYFQFRSRPIF